MTNITLNGADICQRLGAKFLFENPGTFGDVRIIPLTIEGISQSKKSEFSWEIEKYLDLVNSGELPPNCHSLLLGHNETSGVVLSTARPTKQYQYNESVWRRWKGRRLMRDFSSLSGSFILSNAGKQRIANRSIYVVEGQNDALTTYSHLMQFDRKAVVVNLAGSSFTPELKRHLSNYIDWKRCEFVMFMDSEHLGNKISLEVESQLGLSDKQFVIAQNEIPEIGDLDTDDYFTMLESSTYATSHQQTTALNNTLEPYNSLQHDISDELTKKYEELEQLAVFLEYQSNSSFEIRGIVFPKVADSDFYNNMDYCGKPLIRLTAAKDRLAFLSLGETEIDEEYEDNFFCTRNEFKKSQRTASKCKVPLMPLQDIVPGYFEDTSLQ